MNFEIQTTLFELINTQVDHFKCIGHVEQEELDCKRYGELNPFVVRLGAGLDWNLLRKGERSIIIRNS